MVAKGTRDTCKLKATAGCHVKHKMKIRRVLAIIFTFEVFKTHFAKQGLPKRGNTDGVRNQTEPQVLA